MTQSVAYRYKFNITFYIIQQLYGQSMFLKESDMLTGNIDETVHESAVRNGIFIKERDKTKFESKKMQQFIFTKQIVVVQNAIEIFGLEEINLQLINSQCKNQQVQIVAQNPLYFGFSPNKLISKGYIMPINLYCDYQKNYQNQDYCAKKFGKKFKKGSILFAVNFQPQSGTSIKKLGDKLKNTIFKWTQPDDMLSYLEQDINGCSSPQFYLKVKGCWTGGHQENIAMCAININHGPSDSQWCSVAVEDVERLRKTIKQKFKKDIYQNEGLWFLKTNWFIENGFRVTRILQKAGDMVITGPGTLHWVRSYGVALHSSWNIFPQFHKSLVVAYHRQDQNQKIKKSNIIPLKSLTLKHLDHNLFNIPEETGFLLISYLGKWITQQSTQLSSIKLNMSGINVQVKQKILKEQEAFCQRCKQQIFIYFVANRLTPGIICLSCSIQTGCLLQADPDLSIFYRWKPQEMYTFLSEAMTRRLDNTKTRYCSGKHIGKSCKLANINNNIKVIQMGKKSNKMLNEQTRIPSLLQNFIKTLNIATQTQQIATDNQLKRQMPIDFQNGPLPTKRKQKKHSQDQGKLRNTKQKIEERYYTRSESRKNQDRNGQRDKKLDNKTKQDQKIKQKGQNRSNSEMSC